MDKTETVCLIIEYLFYCGALITEVIFIASFNSKRMRGGFHFFTAAFAFSLIGISLGLNAEKLFSVNTESPIVSTLIAITGIVIGCAFTYMCYIVIFHVVSAVFSFIKRKLRRR